MRDFVAKISLTALFVLAIFSASAAEKVTFEANSPLTVAVGEAFRVEFALNAKPDGDTFKAPSFEGFDVLAGPAISQGSSVQIVNGSMTKSVSYTYTFVLLPQAAGNVTIGAAEVKVDGSSYRTRPLPIEIVNEGEGSRAQQQQGGSNRADDTQADAQSRIGKDDILLRAVVSRSSVYKNEPLHVAFKLYTRVPYVNIVPESAPSFNGFWSQDLSDPNSARVGRETYAGKVYETRVLYDYLLYPQQVGSLTIDPVDMTVVAQVVVQSRHADPFFGGGREVFNVPRKVQSQRATVQVKALPAGAPASFSGAVGNFTMDTQFPSERSRPIRARRSRRFPARATSPSYRPRNCRCRPPSSSITSRPPSRSTRRPRASPATASSNIPSSHGPRALTTSNPSSSPTSTPSGCST